MKTRTSLALLAFSGAGLLALTSCSGTGNAAEDFPDGDVRLIVPYSAGGSSDFVSRTIAPYFEQELGVPVVVENIPGASGALGQREMMAEDPDGQTIQLIASTSMAVVPQAEDVGYTLDDVSVIGSVTQYPYVLAGLADGSFEDGEAILEAAEDENIRVGVPGAQSQGAIELQRLIEDHGLNITVVPYDGNADATTALLGNNIDAVFIVAANDIRSFFDSGDFKPLAVDAPAQAPFLEGVPTIEELGFEGISLGTSYYGLGLHSETPEEIRDRYEEVLEGALQDSSVRETLGEEYIAEEFIDGEALWGFFTEQSEAYGPYVGGQ